MAIFIGITGTHSTGKSSYLEALEKRARSLGISVSRISDTATRCQEKGFQILTKHGFESTLWIITTVIQSELEAGLTSELVLVDRPVSDALGYLEAALELTQRSIATTEKEYLYRLVEMHLPRYSLLLQTELDESISLGEGRDTNLEYRRSAARWIKKGLKDMNVETIDPESSHSDGIIEELLSEIVRTR